MKELIALLIKHEGIEFKPYEDTEGKLTIGVGRNLADVGISRDEAMYLLRNDIDRAIEAAEKYPWFSRINPARQAVVISMIFNMGPKRFSRFHKTINFIEAEMFQEAADEMLRSKWAYQVGRRATELSIIMHDGEFLENDS